MKKELKNDSSLAVPSTIFKQYIDDVYIKIYDYTYESTDIVRPFLKRLILEQHSDTFKSIDDLNRYISKKSNQPEEDMFDQFSMEAITDLICERKISDMDIVVFLAVIILLGESYDRDYRNTYGKKSSLSRCKANVRVTWIRYYLHNAINNQIVDKSLQNLVSCGLLKCESLPDNFYCIEIEEKYSPHSIKWQQ